METLQMLAPLPTVNAPDFCFCGRITVESHEYWYCSTNCARNDALRSLNDPECHYRNVVRKAYIRAAALERVPRRMISVDQLRSSDRRLANAPPLFPAPTGPLPNLPTEEDARLARKRNKAGFPTLSQVTGKILAKKVIGGELLIAERRGQPGCEGPSNTSSRARPAPDQPFDVERDSVPLPEQGPVRTIRRVPQSSNSLRSNIRRSVLGLLKGEKSRRGREDGNPTSERVVGHPVNTIVPPVGEESLLLQSQEIPPPVISEQRPKTLRRSVSFAGWDATPQDPAMPLDPLVRILEELREECHGGFDPRSLFEMTEED